MKNCFENFQGLPHVLRTKGLYSSIKYDILNYFYNISLVIFMITSEVFVN